MSVHLIIGASGQVGEHLVHQASVAGHTVVATYHKHPVVGMQQLDIRDAKATETLIAQVQPQVVYLPAALSHVDYCEQYPEETYQINVMGVCNVLRAVNAVGAKLVYFSSDYVFDGKAGPYREEDPPNPICEYGRQKVIAEHQIAINMYDYLIVRTTVVYGWERQGKNFVYRLLNTLKNSEILKAPVDQVGNPTYAPDLAKAVVELIDLNKKGLYHIVGPQRANRYEFACEVARVFALDGDLIQPIETFELGQVAPRPLVAGMVVEKAESVLSLPLLRYQDGLRIMVEQNTAQGRIPEARQE
ncbi:MAG TPA: NAD(P)-dependent oxidoreductase [Chloroflexi bacterium]|nr:NAD(P)-dependent oxidoreductase [Chloroflexota bacterium]